MAFDTYFVPDVLNLPNIKPYTPNLLILDANGPNFDVINIWIFIVREKFKSLYLFIGIV